jgi:hypothetical protein
MRLLKAAEERRGKNPDDGKRFSNYRAGKRD